MGRDLPILFSTSMVQAILDGRKTQTRRVVKPQPKDTWDKVSPITTNAGIISWWFYQSIDPDFGGYKKSPYQVGDRLWVKETHYRYGKWVKNGLTKAGRQKWKFVALRDEVLFMDNPPLYLRPNSFREEAWYKRSPLFLPKKYARIWLEVTGVRADRLQEISASDIFKEGIEMPPPYIGINTDGSPIESEHIDKDPHWFWVKLWDSINGKKYPWSSNPWVFAYEFRKEA